MVKKLLLLALPFLFLAACAAPQTETAVIGNEDGILIEVYRAPT